MTSQRTAGGCTQAKIVHIKVFLEYSLAMKKKACYLGGSVLANGSFFLPSRKTKDRTFRASPGRDPVIRPRELGESSCPVSGG